MAYLPLDIPPGIVRLGTEYQSKGRWRDANLMRWSNGNMQPIGGWAARTTTPMTGKARAAIAWRDNSAVRWIVVGTHSKLYAFTQSATAGADITPSGFTSGRADASAVGGYGGGTYGSGLYGTPRTDSSTIQDATMWTMDTFGQDWYGVSPDDGKIYKWQRDVGVAAAALGGSAPTGNAAIVVTPERFIFALGAAGNPRRVQWPDQESDSTWMAAATNQAGDFDLQTFGRIMCGSRMRATTLILTDVDAHVAEYISQPFIYRFTRVGDNCGVLSRGALMATDSLAFWMGLNGFYAYNGVVSTLPCDVYDYVFTDLNLTQRSKVRGILNSQWNEAWWFYPSAASTENDRAVVYNYAENTWNIHALSRLCGVDRGVFNYPIWCDSSGYLYDHENGMAYSGATPYAESGPFELGNGDRLTKVRELIPDERTQGDMTVSFMARDWPNGAEALYGPYSLTAPTQVRFAARQAKMLVTASSSAASRWGAPRIDVIEGGRR